MDECLSNNTNSCKFACINTLGSYKCQCPVGYHLSADGKKCQDVNDCSLTNRPFHQSQCYNTRGSYQCLPSSCPQQYHQVGGGFCLNQCSGQGYCAPQVIRQEVLPLPLHVPVNTNIALLIPFFPAIHGLTSVLLPVSVHFHSPPLSVRYQAVCKGGRGLHQTEPRKGGKAQTARDRGLVLY